jgi:hypothetical protein
MVVAKWANIEKIIIKIENDFCIRSNQPGLETTRVIYYTGIRWNVAGLLRLILNTRLVVISCCAGTIIRHRFSFVCDCVHSLVVLRMLWMRFLLPAVWLRSNRDGKHAYSPGLSASHWDIHELASRVLKWYQPRISEGSLHMDPSLYLRLEINRERKGETTGII